MINQSVEFENHVDYDTDEQLDELFSEIRKIDDKIHDFVGSHYSLTYFYDESSPLWRFDWGYLWDRNNVDLKLLLKEAISFGKTLVNK